MSCLGAAAHMQLDEIGKPLSSRLMSCMHEGSTARRGMSPVMSCDCLVPVSALLNWARCHLHSVLAADASCPCRCWRSSTRR